MRRMPWLVASGMAIIPPYSACQPRGGRYVSHLRLIHWNAAEARARSAQLRQLGFTVCSGLPAIPDLLRELSASPPAAIVIDLTRSPSHGRELGIALRQRKATRPIPLVFAGGAPEKVARVRGLLPDATFTEWDGIAPALRRAIANPVSQPVVHASAFAAYAGRPLVQRLGIKPKMRVALVAAPRGLRATLAPLPEGVRLTTGVGPRLRSRPVVGPPAGRPQARAPQDEHGP
jgi:hypothetical protein